MAITYPLDLPTITGIRNISLIKRAVVSVSRAPFSGAQQVQEHPGQWFEAEIELPPMTRAQAEVWDSFFLKLNGMKGTFLLGDPAGAIPRGSAATTPGTPLVKGAGQTGNQLIIDGLPTSVTGYFKAGDYIQLGSGSTARLHKNLEDVDTNGSGEATLTLWPNLRSSPADNAAVVVSAAKGRFRLASNEMTMSNQLLVYGGSFSAFEAL